MDYTLPKMVCLLCYDCNGDYISLLSEESEHFKIGSVLFKYFRFMFEKEPDSGEICRKCWMKVEMFHTFYQRIEEIQMTVIKVPTIVVENLNFFPKTEDNTDSILDDRISQIDSKSDVPVDTKFDLDFGDDFWHDESDVSFSENIVTPEKRRTRTQTKSNCERKLELSGEDKVEPKPSKSASNVTSKSKQSIKKKVARSTKDSKLDDDHQQNCPISRKCTQKFGSQDEVIAHCAVDHKRYHCTHCPYLRVFADLYKHLREQHGIIENAICEHCGQIFGCNRTLQDHIKRKHTVCDPVQCDICKEWFKSRETIRSHMSYVHIQGTQTCTICGKVSANRKALRTHLNIHSDAWKDRFKCVICGKGFRSSTKLREHSYIHSGKTDAYICQFCGKSFRFNSSISAHRMKYHPAEMAHVKERLQKKRNMEFKV